MGRPALAKKGPMTGAERQRRRRKKLAGARSVEIKTAYRKKFRDDAALKYCPAPPGITYYEQIAVRLADGATRLVMVPKTKPLAACCDNLDDDDVLALIRQLGAMATERGLTVRQAGELAQVSHETIVGIEAGRASVKDKTIEKVRAALEKAGVEFIDENDGGPGVRLAKPKGKRKSN